MTNSQNTNEEVRTPEEILLAYQLWAVDGQGKDLRLPGKRLTHHEALQAIEAYYAGKMVEARLEELEGFSWCIHEGCLDYAEERILELKSQKVG